MQMIKILSSKSIISRDRDQYLRYFFIPRNEIMHGELTVLWNANEGKHETAFLKSCKEEKAFLKSCKEWSRHHCTLAKGFSPPITTKLTGDT